MRSLKYKLVPIVPSESSVCRGRLFERRKLGITPDELPSYRTFCHYIQVGIPFALSKREHLKI